MRQGDLAGALLMTNSPSTGPITKSRLSELALDAAIELDRAAHTKIVASTPGIDRFFRSLREQLDQDRLKVFKDQTLVPVYALALSRSAGDPFVAREDLAGLLQEVLKKHDAVVVDTDAPAEAQIAFLRDFCLAVHEALILNLMGNRMTAVKHDERARYN